VNERTGRTRSVRMSASVVSCESPSNSQGFFGFCGCGGHDGIDTDVRRGVDASASLTPHLVVDRRRVRSSTKTTTMATKRRRLGALDDHPRSTHRASLTTLPFEILAEILLHTCSPPTVLAVARTSSFLYRSLAQNPAASFIWRGVRSTCAPAPLPDPGDGWKKSEADYAAFVFGGGVCEVCRKTTRVMYMSFAARIRLCGSVSVRCCSPMSSA
jgi:hypothetical protein